MRRLRVGLLGCGVVGGGFVELVNRERPRIASRYGLDLSVAAILVRDRDKPRATVDRSLLTTCALDVIDSGCDVVVEVIGGVHSAGTFVRRALSRGLNVVTANKALLAAAGSELFETARRHGVELGFEASVCGAVPVIGTLRRALAGDSVESITGIVNGTSNYVLCRMEEGLEVADAILCAQERGFAESDPTLDVTGVDAAQKLAILAQLAFDEPVRRSWISGIGGVTQRDVEDSRRRGEVIRLVGEVRRVAGGVELEVAPRSLPASDPLARVIDEQNGVVIRGRAVGEVYLCGRGAGSLPTAAALLSDVIAAGHTNVMAAVA